LCCADRAINASGRIIARFSKDQEVVDTDFPDLTSDFFLCLFSTFATLMVICGILPWFLLPAIPVMAVYWWIMQHYRKASRGMCSLHAHLVIQLLLFHHIRWALTTPHACTRAHAIRAEQAERDGERAHLRALLGDARRAGHHPRVPLPAPAQGGKREFARN
jgi:hypothetical protein